MKMNQNNDITIHRGEAVVIDFKLSQRTDYYVPFLVSQERNNPMVCITIGSTRRESKNIVTQQHWIELNELPRFISTVVIDYGEINDTVGGFDINDYLTQNLDEGYMYQYFLKTEVDAGNPIRHFVYLNDGTPVIDEYEFTITMVLDNEDTRDLTNIEYYYQIELMSTQLMVPYLVDFFTLHDNLIAKLPAGFTLDETGVITYLRECITLINKLYPMHWSYRIADPFTSPVATVDNVQIIQAPRAFIVQSVVK